MSNESQVFSLPMPNKSQVLTNVQRISGVHICQMKLMQVPTNVKRILGLEWIIITIYSNEWLLINNNSDK